MTTIDTEDTTESGSAEEDSMRAVLPCASALTLDRAAGALLARGTAQDDIPEALMRQLQDPAVLEDTPIYWFRSVGSNGGQDHYGTIMQTDSLRNYAKDAQSGLPFCNSHRMEELPFGRTFDGQFHQARGSNLARTSMDVYMPLDTNVNGVDTTHFMRGVRSGVIRDVSIKFLPERIQCSIDDKNMARTLWELLFSDPDDPDSPCRHLPGITYKIDGKKIRALGRVFGAHCLHLSPVWKGATPGAAILNKSRSLVIDERAAPPDWVLETPCVQMAGMLADADQLDRETALAIEEHVRGISFPSITAERIAGVDLERARKNKKRGNPLKPPSDDNPDPDNDGDDDRTPEGDTDHSHWTADGKKKKDKWVDHTKREESADMPPDPEGRADTGEAAQTSEATAAGATTEGTDQASEAPPPVSRSEPRQPEPAPAIEHTYGDAEIRAVLLDAGLAPREFDGDPIERLRVLGRELQVERTWGGWGRRYRKELCEEIEREGVRAFGAEGWTEGRAAYVGTLERGDADELIALRKHFESEAARRLQGGRATREDEHPADARQQPAATRPRIPAAAFRS